MEAEYSSVKTCYVCKAEKPVEDFALNPSRKDGRGTSCRDCHRIYRKTHYEANRQKYIDKARKQTVILTARNRQELIKYMEGRSCLDCGNDDFEVLDFDHRDAALKSFEISQAISDRSWSSILAEIEKCDIRCANCHRKRTNRQFGYWRSNISAL